VPIVTHHADGVVLRLFVQPRSSINKVCGEHAGALKINLTAPPVEGKANRAVVDFLSSLFDLPKKNIQILSGHQSRKKRVLLLKLDLEDVQRDVQKHIKK